MPIPRGPRRDATPPPPALPKLETNAAEPSLAPTTMEEEGPSTRSRSRRAAAAMARPHSADAAAAAASPFLALAGADASSGSSDSDALFPSRTRRKRKAPAGRKPRRKPQDQGATTQISVFYGSRRHFLEMTGKDLEVCSHVDGELPPQPQSMSLVDLQLWIFKLFRLHPETHDLFVRGFFKEYTHSMFEYLTHSPDWYLEYCEWEARMILDDGSWRSFAKKMKSRNAIKKFVLYVDSSEIKHYDILLKAAADDYSQLPPVVLPGTKSLSRYNYIEKRFGFGTFYDSHNLAPRFLKEIVLGNPGAFVDIKDTEVPGCEDFRELFWHMKSKGVRVLHRIFWAFAQCINAFKYCRPVLYLKGMPLCGKYRGVLLTAVAFDANDSAVPVAYAVVEGETKDSWLWFLRNVKPGVVKERSSVCVIHECKRKLISAIDDIQNNQKEPHPWKDVQNRWCMEHLAENFLVYFDDKDLMMMFKRLCQQKRESKFVEIWKELDKLTLKYAVQKEGDTHGEMQQESFEHGETGFEVQSPHKQLDSVKDEENGDDADDSNHKITKFSEWIRGKPVEKWSMLHDTNGARYGIMHTTVADVYNHVWKWITCLPLAGIVEVSFERTADYFKKTMAAGNLSIKFLEDDMNSKLQKSKMYDVIRINTKDTELCLGDFKVQSGQKNLIVHLNSEYIRRTNTPKGFTLRKSAKCSCNRPQLLRKPCSHVIAVSRRIGVPAATYISPYYSMSYLVKTWSGFDVSKIRPKDGPNDGISMSIPWATWIPDKKLECYLPVSLTPDSTQADMGKQEYRWVVESGYIETFGARPRFY